MMSFDEIAAFLSRCGYSGYDTKENHRVFYEFGKTNFLYSKCAKKFDFDYIDGNVEKVVMTQYWLGTTTFKDIYTIEELEDSI